MMNALNPYLKAIVALMGMTISSLAQLYPTAKWLPILVALVTAINVYLVPNLPKNGAVPTQPMPAIQKDSTDNPFGG